MNQNELAKFTDEELIIRKKKLKSTSITNAVLIGFMIGIIIYSATNNSIGFFTFIPLIFIYKIAKDSKKSIVLKKELEKRGLN